MSKTFQKLFFCFLLLSATTLTQAQFSGNGSGTPSDPYIITTPAQLNEVRNDMEVHYKLQNDIDLTDYLAPGGDGYKQWGDTGWKPIGHYNTMFDWADFTGSFNGAGYKIIGLWINRPNEMRIGFFGQTYNVTIDSLGIEIAEAGIKGGGHATIGGLVGSQVGLSDNINHCYVTGGGISQYGASSFAIHAVGGLVGYKAGTINRCYATVDVYSDDGVAGGLVGYNGFGYINNCYVTGNVTSSSSIVGGLAGWQDSGGTRINNCYAVGNISGTYAGGLVGQ